MRSAYIACQVFPGLFETEYYVMVNGSSAYYVSRSNVRGVAKTPTADNAVKGEVLGYVIERKSDKTLVQLSGEPVLGGLRTWVSNSAVTTA